MLSICQIITKNENNIFHKSSLCCACLHMFFIEEYRINNHNIFKIPVEMKNFKDF